MALERGRIIRTLTCTAFAICFLSVLAVAESPEDESVRDANQEARNRMVERDIAGSGFGRIPVKDERVLRAMRAAPRHEFVPAELARYAHADRPLPIGYGQTISQPYIVGFMTELLKLREESVVLEIGTGSGYQAAVCAEIAKKVYSIEIVRPLADTAKKRLERLGYTKVTCRTGDGYFGWQEHAPFDAIIVTAAASHIPPPLIEQLKPGGRMAIPVGSPTKTQSLMLVEKKEDGTVVKRNLMAVRFVPLTREKEESTP